MSIRVKLLAAMAGFAGLASIPTLGAISASAGTPQCGAGCIDIFSKAYGTYAQPNFIETVHDGVAQAGQPTELFPVSSTNSAQDLMPIGGTVNSFYAQGMVSAAVDRAFSPYNAAQIEFAPLGVPTGLCAALASSPSQNDGLVLEPCTTPGTTVWIIDTGVSTAPMYFALVNGATQDLIRPFAMTYLVDPARQAAQIVVQHLQLNQERSTVSDRQLWGAEGPQS